MLSIMSGISSGNKVTPIGDLHDKYINGTHDETIPDDITLSHFPDVGQYRYDFSEKVVKKPPKVKKSLWDD